MGTQIHATNNYRRVVEQIRAGRIGDVSEVHVWVSKDWGADQMPEPDGEPAPETLDWNRWLGPAPKRGYTSALHPRNWRRYRPYGAGTLGDMGCHYIDLPFWALGLKYPDRVVADGPPPREKTCPRGLSVEYRFPATDVHDEIKLVWYDGRRAQQYVSGKEFPGSGVLFVGDRGKMLATYSSYEVFPKERTGADLDVDTIPPSIGHHAEWIRAITGGPEALCHFGYAGPLTETVLLGTVAHRAGRPLRWDGGSAKVVDDPEADALLRKEYRDGWEVAGAEREQKLG
jgi:predicted dehydrogenase